jgi:hypothetical protein
VRPGLGGVLSVWESGEISTEAAVARVIDHYKALATIMAVSSDGRARPNSLGGVRQGDAESTRRRRDDVALGRASDPPSHVQGLTTDCV